jgi:hypothetical protein
MTKQPSRRTPKQSQEAPNEFEAHTAPASSARHEAVSAPLPGATIPAQLGGQIPGTDCPSLGPYPVDDTHDLLRLARLLGTESARRRFRSAGCAMVLNRHAAVAVALIAAALMIILIEGR